MKRIIPLIVGGIITGLYVPLSVHALIEPTPVIVEQVREEKEVVVQVATTTEWTTDKIEQHIRDSFPEEPETAVAVARCESQLKTDAVNTKNTNGSVDSGLWQINSVHSEALQKMEIDPFDVEEATRFARHLYEKNGWNDWVCARMI